MDKTNFKERVVGDSPPMIVDAEWDENRTGVITLTLQREGEAVYQLRIGTLCGDPHPELVPDPVVRRRLRALPDLKQAALARALGFDPDNVPYPQFVSWLFKKAWENDKLDELEALIALAEGADAK